MGKAVTIDFLAYWQRLPKWGKQISTILVLAGVFYGMGRLGQLLALPIPPGSITAVWPPSGIAFVAVLLLGYRVWPAFWIGEFFVNIWGYFDGSSAEAIAKSIGVGVFDGIGASLESIVGAYLLWRFVGSHYPFNRARNVFYFTIVSLLCTMVSATIGVTAFCVGGFSNWAEYFSLWFTWWIGNSVGILVMAPLLLTWIEYPHLTAKDRRYLPEFFLWLVFLLSLGTIAFAGGYPIAYLLLPVLVWAAFRFGQRGAATAILLVSGMAVWGTSHGEGFFIQDSLNESLLLLQSFIGVVSLTTMFLTAVLSERQQAETALQQANEELEIRVEKRTLELSHTVEKLQQEIEERQRIEANLRSMQDQIIVQEKLASLGSLTAGIAHEIRNPLNFVNNFAELSVELAEELVGELSDRGEAIDADNREYLEEILSDLKQNLEKIHHHGQRADRIVGNMLLHSRSENGHWETTDLNSLLAEYVNLAYHGMRAKDTTFQIAIATDYDRAIGKIEVVPQDISRVFLNLLNNACYATHQKKQDSNGEFSPQMSVTSKNLGDRIEIRIRDNGNGISQAALSKIFTPFFTTKPAGEGTGLGLSIAHDIIVKQHRGELTVESEPGSYAEFKILLPKTQQIVPEV